MHNVYRPVYVINLESRPDRREFMEVQCAERGVEFVRIVAHTENDAIVALRKDGGVSAGELACTMSHMKALRTFLETDADAAVVLEDDAVLSRDFRELIAHQFATAPDLVKLETRRLSVRVGRVRERVSNRYESRRLLSPHYGTCGYIVSRRLAKKALVELPQFRGPIDCYFFSERGPVLFDEAVFQVVPGACVPLDGLAAFDASQAARSDIARTRSDVLRTFQGSPLVARVKQLAATLCEPQAFSRRSIPFVDE